MKNIMIVIGILALCGMVFAALPPLDEEMTYCESSVSHIDEENWLARGIKFVNDSDCVCYNDIPKQTQWRDVMCEKIGMLQYRYATGKISPDCKLFATTTEYRHDYRDYCTRCDPPEYLSDWEKIRCEDNDTGVYRRLAFGETFGSSADKCKGGNVYLIEKRYEKDCVMPSSEPTSYISSLFGDNIVVGILIIAFFLLVISNIYIQSKKKKKGGA